MVNHNMKEVHTDVNAVVEEMEKKKLKDKREKEEAEDKIFGDYEDLVLVDKDN